MTVGDRFADSLRAIKALPQVGGAVSDYLEEA